MSDTTKKTRLFKSCLNTDAELQTKPHTGKFREIRTLDQIKVEETVLQGLN